MATRIIPEKINLPSGGWVKFYDPEDLTGEDHRQIMSTVKGDPQNEQVAMAMDILRATAEALIEAWEIPYVPKGTSFAAGSIPVPENYPGILGKLRMPDYSAILGAITPVMRLLNGGGAVSVDDAAVPGSPTVPSGG